MAADLATAIYEQSLRLPPPPRPTLYIRITQEGGMHDQYAFLLEMQYEAGQILVTEHGSSWNTDDSVFWSSVGSGQRKLSFRMKACTPAICKFMSNLQRSLDWGTQLDNGLEGLMLHLVEAPPSQTQKESEFWIKIVVPKYIKIIRCKAIEEINTESELTVQLTDILVSWMELGAMYQPSSDQSQ